MIYRPIIAAQASGSLGGTVFSHTRGTQYTRARVTPIDPDTLEQAAVRQAMSDLAARWGATLSAAQRAAWDRFAAANAYPNRIGDKRRITGKGEYFRANLARRAADNFIAEVLNYCDDPSPIGPTVAPDNTFTVEIGNPAAAELDLSWSTEQHYWDDPQDAALFYVSDPQPSTVNWFRGPFTLFAIVTGDISPTYNVACSALAPLVSGKRYFWKFRLTTHDGRLAPLFTGVLVP